MRELIGHSGCKIFLLNTRGAVEVRKISKSLEYNNRLEAQCVKQINYKGSLNVPEVIKTGVTEEGLFFFDMEFINGTVLSNKIKYLTIHDIDKISEELVDHTRYSSPHEITVNPQFVIEKINNLKLDLKECIPINRALKLLINADWSGIFHSDCHGDYTLENIIVRNNKLYAIDFLDSFIESPYIDISKLLMDLIIKWSLRNGKCDVNTLIKYDLMYKKIINLAEDRGLDMKKVFNFSMLNLLRIAPYSNPNTLNMKIIPGLEELEILSEVYK